MGLASEGYQLSYRRIPLSRDRTPEAADLDTLHAQLQQHPPGAPASHNPAGAVPGGEVVVPPVYPPPNPPPHSKKLVRFDPQVAPYSCRTHARGKGLNSPNRNISASLKPYGV